ncbi:uncharacterized protein PGRI_080940 [Penicillium griseofulvum]|uniref:Uncharacterized protein n=1 Tax=Penicillium patulum TaxID=5078 RepID=A0A135LV36_PENPA|nr:uncharacterized protein PGRI_080940 [Penicillium griseofulvum]KXG52838.1 hypothetical protein PGRI_080940 [Penicillium griseofulvum]
MTNSKEVGSEGGCRQQAHMAKILKKVKAKYVTDCIESTSNESLWELYLQFFRDSNELEMVRKAGSMETLPIGEADRDDILTGFGLQWQSDKSLKLHP